ncbi:MAG: SHOCT domain-containing protein [Chloroflexi bacterium]|nr:SHOCT domain-containing protein [Chloroflexota bacterium]
MGLIKTALKTAVAVKTAHVVHDRIQRRQGEQWAATTQAAAPVPVDDTLARLSQLGELRASGVLTEDEFEAQKARILTG